MSLRITIKSFAAPVLTIAAALALAGCAAPRAFLSPESDGQSSVKRNAPERDALAAAQERAASVAADADASAPARAAAAGVEQTTYTRVYDASYQRLDYPNGDVPEDRGACTDVVIRAFRKLGVDLQKELHEDMNRNFAAYPRTWGAARTDRNIDHRRVPNLMTYFERRGKSLPVTNKAEDYEPGDVVTWRFDNGLTHIGLVTDEKSPDTGRRLIVHNIGAGAQLEDVLFAWKITGRYRYFDADGSGEQGREN